MDVPWPYRVCSGKSLWVGSDRDNSGMYVLRICRLSFSQKRDSVKKPKGQSMIVQICAVG